MRLLILGTGAEWNGQQQKQEATESDHVFGSQNFVLTAICVQCVFVCRQKDKLPVATSERNKRIGD